MEPDGSGTDPLKGDDMSKKSLHESKKSLHDYWINVGVGLAIFFICMFAENFQWGEEIQNLAYDALIRFEKKLQSDDSWIAERVKCLAGCRQRQETSLFFVDITEREYRDMREPLITPRRRIAELIKAAWKKDASVIFLDIQLDKINCCDRGGDKELSDLLLNMIKNNSKTKVIIPVKVGADSVLKAGVFDDIFVAQIKEGRKIFYRAIAEASAPESDYRNRFFTVYKPFFDKKNKLDIIWSAPVLATVLLNGKESELEKMKTAAEQSHCVGHETPVATLQLLENGGRMIDVFPVLCTVEGGKTLLKAGTDGEHKDDHSLRIRYLLDDKHLGYHGDNNLIGDRVEAKNFTVDSLPESLFGKIVVIGNSSPEAGDIHPTPVGPMAGMYIVGNAINTVNADLQPKFKRGFQVFIELLGVFIAAYIFLRLTPFPAQIVASTILIIILIPISTYCFLTSGVFINFLIPIAGMKLHRIASNIEIIIKTRVLKKRRIYKR